MCRYLLACFGLPVLFGLLSSTAAAQPPIAGTNPSSRPAVSPYINLTNPNQSPVISYYGIVRPAFGYNSTLQQLETQQANISNQQAQQFTVTNVLPPTGHAAGFFTQGRYFLTKGASGAAGGVGPIH